MKLHRKAKRLITVSAVHPSARFGEMVMEGDRIVRFDEKPTKSAKYINGGYMVCNPGIFDYLEDDNTVLEKEPMRALAAAGELKSFYHNGFWQCMDTKREKDLLEKLWATGHAPWKVWED